MVSGFLRVNTDHIANNGKMVFFYALKVAFIPSNLTCHKSYKLGFAVDDTTIKNGSK